MEEVLRQHPRHLEDQFLNQAFCFCPDGALLKERKKNLLIRYSKDKIMVIQSETVFQKK